MLVQIVVLYMVYTFDLPGWCRWFIWISMVIKVMSFLTDIYKAGTEVGHEK